MEKNNSFWSKVIGFVIRIYQWFISPVLPSSCRFWPTCSTYFYQAVKFHGVFRGSFLGFRRVCKCHPWHEGGIDPVPKAQDDFKSCSNFVKPLTNND